MWSALVLAISEPLVISLVLATYLFAIAGQRTRARASASLLLLAREAAVLALVPMVARDVRERGTRSITSWALVPFPLFGWWIWVRARVGEWPFLDPSISRRQALGWPCAGAVTVIREGASANHWLAFALGALTVIGGVYVARRHRWFPLSDGALMLSLLVLFFGSNAWRYPGEAIRLLALPQALIVLCIATTPGRRMPVAPRRRLSVR
jgi:hypothetical protein